MIGAALNWIINYHCDGLRVDMTKFMDSDFTMKQMIAEINYHSPYTFIIAEDGRDNDIRVTKPFPQEEQEENEFYHCKFIKKISDNEVSLSALGFDTEWDFPFHKQIASSVLGSWDCRIKNISNLDYSLRDAQTRVKYAMSHDEIGNVDGTRLITKIISNELGMNKEQSISEISGLSKLIAHSAHKIITMFVSGELEQMSTEEREKLFFNLNLPKDLTLESIYNSYINAVKMHKLALGKVYSIPGPKMVFQGQKIFDRKRALSE